VSHIIAGSSFALNKKSFKGTRARGGSKRKAVTKKSIIDQTCSLQNLPYPLFFKEGNSSLLQREGRRDFVFGVYTDMT
jgi:hypothetical protein